MKKIISSLLFVAVLLSVCEVCFENIETSAGAYLKFTYVMVHENTVETSESVVYEQPSVKSDLQVASNDPEGLSKSSAGASIANPRKAVTVVNISLLCILLLIGMVCPYIFNLEGK